MGRVAAAIHIRRSAHLRSSPFTIHSGRPLSSPTPSHSSRLLASLGPPLPSAQAPFQSNHFFSASSAGEHSQLWGTGQSTTARSEHDGCTSSGLNDAAEDVGGDCILHLGDEDCSAPCACHSTKKTEENRRVNDKISPASAAAFLGKELLGPHYSLPEGVTSFQVPLVAVDAFILFCMGNFLVSTMLMNDEFDFCVLCGLSSFSLRLHLSHVMSRGAILTLCNCPTLTTINCQRLLSVLDLLEHKHFDQ
ncbi:hypothetical protein CRG98_037199 [Punica granatum]|uniref:Uncharacterized protein n=1 Tax=Punica granatum TaxID=22663 RepID=A0A2I0IEH6_PUNGR|nr:hypothetical protein CRG98_037199 [Punica granatum]